MTTTGRKTGKKRRKCVRAIHVDDKAYLVMLAPALLNVPREQAVAAWLRNIRADSRVRLRVRDGAYSGVAAEPSDPAEIERARRIYCETVNPFDWAENAFHLAGRPSRERIQRLHAHWFDMGVPVVIQLDRREGAR